MNKNSLRIYIGADHRGYELKEKLFQWLVEHDYKVEDFGAYEFNKEDDYTTYAEKVASVVGQEEFSRGVLLCGSGVGVDVVANKFDGVRASVAKDNDQVRAGRSDDDMNVLVLAADYTDEKEAETFLETFLKTPFSGKDRYVRRLEEIKKLEENN